MPKEFLIKDGFICSVLLADKLWETGQTYCHWLTGFIKGWCSVELRRAKSLIEIEEEKPGRLGSVSSSPGNSCHTGPRHQCPQPAGPQFYHHHHHHHHHHQNHHHQHHQHHHHGEKESSFRVWSSISTWKGKIIKPPSLLMTSQSLLSLNKNFINILIIIIIIIIIFV